MLDVAAGDGLGRTRVATSPLAFAGRAGADGASTAAWFFVPLCGSPFFCALIGPGAVLSRDAGG